MKRLLHVVSFTTDIDTSRQFYRDAVGLVPGADTPFMVDFSTGAAGLMLLAVQPAQRREVELCFESERVGAVVETLRGRGVEFIDELRHLAFGSVIHFRDPDGNLLSLLQPGSGAAMTAAERKSRAEARSGGAAESGQGSLALDDMAPAVGRGPVMTTAIVQVQDMAAARAYFGRLLGLKETVQSPLWQQYDTGDIRLALQLHRDRDSADRYLTQPVSFGFGVGDLEEWKRGASARGTVFALVPPKGGLGSAVELRDPEGNLLVVREHVSETLLQQRLDAAQPPKAARSSSKPAKAGGAAKASRTKRAATERAATERAATERATPKRAATGRAAPKPAAPGPRRAKRDRRRGDTE